MIPEHIAIIPDGNRRWAKRNRKTLVQGYLAGIDRIGDALQWGRDFNLRSLTFWGLSTENLSREERELNALMRLFKIKFKEALSRDEFHEHGIRFRVFGDRSLLPRSIRNYIRDLEDSTKSYSNHFTNVLLGYGGRQELVNACNAILADSRKERIRKVDEATFSRYLYTGELTEPDLIIRTSGEQRLSGFLPWHSAYSEFYFSEHLWPDFTKRDMGAAIREYGRRKRRFGR